MTSPTTSSSDLRTTLYRRCLADFMDTHQEAFTGPARADSWAHCMDQPDMLQPADSRVLDKALGMVMAVMRSASQSMTGGGSLPELFDRAKQMGALEFEPDAGALQMALEGNTEPSEAVAYGRGIAVYRECIARGALDGSELSVLLMNPFDQLPAVTPLMRSAIGTAKRMIQIDIDLMLRPEESHAQV